jgi:sodium-dependent phosphate cotransporter
MAGEGEKPGAWDLKVMVSTEKPWAHKTASERIQTVALVVSKVVLVVLLLYMFILSLGLMGNAFKIVGGKTSGRAFRNSELFDNPVAGLVLGILATVLVQSSSTSTSVIITMAAADLVTLKNAIPMIMGANIGTSVTASIVSVAHISNKDEYRRAFAGAIAHNCFNILTVLIMMPLEVFTGLLMHISEACTSGVDPDEDDAAQKHNFLKVVTKPVSKRLVQIDKKLITKISMASEEELEKLEKTSLIVQKRDKDNHLFMDTPMTDEAAGYLLVFVSLCLLSLCLILLVKTLQSLFKGRAGIVIQKALNLEFKTIPFVADYVLMLFGVGLTILMQSSSVTTSALTPLVGMGMIRVDKMFPFTIGANIGTTITGLLAAMASSNIKVGMQVALAHLFFNLFGTTQCISMEAHLSFGSRLFS